MSTFDMLRAVNANPFIPRTLSAKLFVELHQGKTLTMHQVFRLFGASPHGGDKDYVFGILRRELKWLYELEMPSGKKSKAEVTLNMRSKIRMRPRHRISQARWDRQLENTERNERIRLKF